MARPRKYDDDEILDRAMETFWRRGWNSTSIRDLELALDLKAPSIYRRFGSKDELGAAVVDHYTDRVIVRRVGKLLPGTGDPVANIAMFLDRSVTEADDGGGLWGCLLTTASLEVREPGVGLGLALQRGHAVVEQGLRREVERAASLGRLAPGVDSVAATATLTLVMQGLMALARGGSPSAELRRRARAAVSVLTTDAVD